MPTDNFGEQLVADAYFAVAHKCPDTATLVFTALIECHEDRLRHNILHVANAVRILIGTGRFAIRAVRDYRAIARLGPYLNELGWAPGDLHLHNRNRGG